MVGCFDAIHARFFTTASRKVTSGNLTVQYVDEKHLHSNDRNHFLQLRDLGFYMRVISELGMDLI